MDHEFGEPNSHLLKRRIEPYSTGRSIQGDYYPPDHTIHKILDRIRLFDARLHHDRHQLICDEYDRQRKDYVESLINFHYSLFKDFIYLEENDVTK